MDDDDPPCEDRTASWESVYRDHDATVESWYQEEPTLSLDLVERLRVGDDASVIGVGGAANDT